VKALIEDFECKYRIHYCNGINSFAVSYSVSNFNRLIFVLNGALDSVTDSGVHHCVRGDLLYIPHGMRHRNTIAGASADYERYVIYWYDSMFEGDAEFASQLAEIFARGGKITLDEGDIEWMRQNFSRMFENREDRQLVRRILAMVCCALSRMERFSRPDEPRVSYITDVRQYICSHYREKMTAAILAEKFHVSRTKLMCDFRENVYTSLNVYITNERLLHARQFLSEGKSVSEAAELSGFESERNFRRCFVKQLGMTPSGYRANGEKLNDMSDI